MDAYWYGCLICQTAKMTGANPSDLFCQQNFTHDEGLSNCGFHSAFATKRSMLWLHWYSCESSNNGHNPDPIQIIWYGPGHCFFLFSIDPDYISAHILLVFNQDPIYVFRFWSKRIQSWGIKLKTYASEHPQTDESTEVMALIVENFLRCCVTYSHENCVEQLSTADFAFGSAYVDSIGMKPFQADLDWSSKSRIALLVNSEVATV